MYTSKYYTVEEIDERLKQGYFNDALEQGFVGTLREFWAFFLSISDKVEKKEGWGLSENNLSDDLLEKLKTITVPTKVSELQNDAKYQTEDDVKKFISDLVDGADEALDTLKELAEALNNNPNFATDITNKLTELRNQLQSEVSRATEAEAKLAQDIEAQNQSLNSIINEFKENVKDGFRIIQESITQVEAKVDKNKEDISALALKTTEDINAAKLEALNLVNAEKERAQKAENDNKEAIRDLRDTHTTDIAAVRSELQNEASIRDKKDSELAQSIEDKTNSLKEGKVDWTSVPTTELPNRKSIVLKNGDVILGGMPGDKDNAPLVQLNRGGIADFGSTKVPLNFNTPKDVRPTVQEEGQAGEEAYRLAYLEDLNGVDNKIAQAVAAEKLERQAADEALDKKIEAIKGTDLTQLGEKLDKEIQDRKDADDTKVDKVEGYGLSKNDFTDVLLEKLNGIQDHANYITKVSELLNDQEYQTLEQVNAAIEKIVGSAPEVLNTLQEIAKALGDDPNFSATITKKLAAITEQLNQEVSDRKEAITEVNQSIAKEVSDRKEAIANTESLINAEVIARKEADTNLQNGLSQEIQDRKDAIIEVKGLLTQAVEGLTKSYSELKSSVESSVSLLQGQIRAQDQLIATNTKGIQSNLALIQEIQSRLDSGSITKPLEDALAKEIQDRKDADQVFDTRLTAVESRLDSEIANREAADTVLQNHINDEASERAEADTALDNKLSKQISDEATARDNADKVLDQKISDLQTTKDAEIKDLQDKLSQEITDRTNGDSGLSTRIDKTNTDLQAEVSRAISVEDSIKSGLEAEVQNRADGDKAITTDLTNFKNTKGKANGLASLDDNGKVPSSQLPEAVYSVVGIEVSVANIAERDQVPDIEEGDKVYVQEDKKIYTKTADGWDAGATPIENVVYNFRRADSEGRTNIIKRWDGKDFAVISETLALGETEGTAFEGSKGKKLSEIVNSLPGRILEYIDNPTYSPDTVSLPYISHVQLFSDIYEEEERAEKVIESATVDRAGVMTAADKKKLEGLPSEILGDAIQLHTFEEAAPGDLQIKPTDTISQAIAKLKKQSEIDKDGITANISSLISVLGITEEFELPSMESTKHLKEIKTIVDGLIALDKAVGAGGGSIEQPINPTPGQTYFDTTQNKLGIWNGTAWVDSMGNPLESKRSGTTEERPTGVQIGYIYHNTDEGIFEAWDGETWIPITYLVTTVNQLTFNPDGGAQSLGVRSNTKWRVE